MFTTMSSSVTLASIMGARGVGRGCYVGLSVHLFVVSRDIFIVWSNLLPPGYSYNN